MRMWLIGSALLTVAGCGRTDSVKMTDPRTGVSVTCESGRYNLFTPQSIRDQVGICVSELSFYGFREDAELRAAHNAKPEEPKESPWTRFDPL